MTIRELAKVYYGRAIVTSIAYFKKDGSYYSFRTIGDFQSLTDIPEFYDNEIKSIRVDRTGFLWIDIIEWI